MMARTGFARDDLPPAAYWTTGEERTLLKHYGRLDVGTCCRLLPGRTKRAIRQRAYVIRKRGAVA